MTDIDDISNQLFITLRYDFLAIKVRDQKLIPSSFNLKVDAMMDNDESDDPSSISVVVEKLRYWIDNVVTHSLMISCDNEWAHQSLMYSEEKSPAENAIMLLPEDPSDALIAEIILCKMKALSGNVFDFGAIEIQSSDSKGLNVTFMGDPGSDFPEPSDWLGERNFFSKPWWHRDDASSMDVVPNEDDDLNIPPAFAYSLGFIAEKMANPAESESKVVRAEFRPKLIIGGKTD